MPPANRLEADAAEFQPKKIGGTRFKARFARSYAGPNQRGPNPGNAKQYRARNLQGRDELCDEKSDSDDVPPPAKALEKQAQFRGKDAEESV
jgi:hypothetical protein